MRWALALTTIFMAIEVVAGLWSGSLALLADAGHMLTDSAALALALIAVVVSRRPPDARRTYGYGRMRVLAAFINGLGLLVIALWIVIEAASPGAWGNAPAFVDSWGVAPGTPRQRWRA